MTACKYDPDTGAYLIDGEHCRTDDYGDPTNHCQARRTCSQHVGWGELTCARCLGRVRMDIRVIVGRYAEVLPEAIESGVNSQAANLAGPGTDPEAWSWRKAATKQALVLAELTGRPTKVWHASLIEDDDDRDAYRVLTTWAQMLSEDYKTDRPEVWTITNAASYLDRILGRMAQDDAQDFPLLAREVRKCRTHLESVLSDSLAPERGAPCPTCGIEQQVIRLVREYPHFCWDEDCNQIHYDTDEADRWVCPRNPQHTWTVREYENWVEERLGA